MELTKRGWKLRRPLPAGPEPRPYGSSYPIMYGDRLFVRLVRLGRVVMEFMVTCVGDYTELLAEVHRNTRQLRGLVMMSVRNMLRGWSMERPMMLGYSRSSAPDGERYAGVTTEYGHAPKSSVAPVRMLMPWETH